MSPSQNWDGEPMGGEMERLPRPLDVVECRVLGALMEKEQATPDHYPLTLNALIAACNQKSNREPVMALSRGEVTAALDRLRQNVLVWRSEGARSEKWRHAVDRRWGLEPATKALMTLLLLRGPQTPGELRGRSDRLHSFGSPQEVERTLEEMAVAAQPLVRELPRQPGQKGNRWTHLVGDDEVAASAAAPDPGRQPVLERAPQAAAGAPSKAPATGTGGSLAGRVERLERKVEELERRLASLS